MSETWFTADTHFGHENIISFCNRPYTNAAEMDAELCKNWNRFVNPGDTVYHLGDVKWWKKNHRFTRHLAGKIKLIPGNHDYPDTWEEQEFPGWEILPGMVVEKVCGYNVTLCHYPMRQWSGTFHFHGHSHGKMGPWANSLDVGVDCHHYYPVLAEDAIAMAKGVCGV